MPGNRSLIATRHHNFVRRLSATALLGVFALGLVAPADAVRRREQENPITNAPEEEVAKEISTPDLPPFPSGSNWVEFKPNGRTLNRYFVDGESLSIGKDKVIRFTLLVRSDQNVDNISYVGLRCRPREWRDYAFGTPEKTWRREPDSPWRTLEVKTFNNYQDNLAKDYFCVGGAMSGGPAGSEKLLLRKLKYPAPQDTRTPAQLRPQ